MADFRPPSSETSEPIKSDKTPVKGKTTVLVSRRQQGPLWRKIGLVGSVAVMGGQPVLAQMDFNGGDAIALPTIVDVAPEAGATTAAPVEQPLSIAVSDPIAVEPAPVIAPPPVAVEPAPVVPVAPPVAVEPVPIAEPVVTAPVVVPPAATPDPQAPSFSTSTPPAVDVVTPNDVVPTAIPTAEDLAADYGGVFVDPTDYSVGATVNPNAPEVFVSDRSTGCEYNASNISACGVPGQPPVAVAGAPGLPGGIPAPTAGGRSFSIGPVSISRSGVRFSGGGLTTAAGREYYNTVAKPLVALQAGESFVFPLASPSPITSLFGWRWHPIHQDYRFHGGTDLGAPQGTPILATQAGQVSLADYLGGYGLTVILRHGDNSLESRYAHMSHILVKPGEHVEQGDVIGLVGSTGNSTGPHLHFELHQLTSQGWVAISPNEVLEYALAQIDERIASNPLQVVSIVPKAQAAPPAKAALPKAIKTETLVSDAPHFRPAQPNAQ